MLKGSLLGSLSSLRQPLQSIFAKANLFSITRHSLLQHAALGRFRHRLPVWIMRSLWLLLVLISAYVLWFAMPLLYSHVVEPQPQPLDPASLVITLAQVRALARIGLTPADYGLMIVGVRLAFVLAFIAVAGFIMWQRPTHPVAALVAIFLVAFGANGVTEQELLKQVAPLAYQLSELLQLAATALLLVILYLFPDGHFVPRWTRYLMWPWLALNVAWYFLPDLWFNPLYGSTWLRTFAASFFFSQVWIFSGFAAMISRYRHWANPVQRRQMRLVMATWLLALIAGTLFICVPALLDQQAIYFDGAVRVVWNIGFYFVVGVCVSSGALAFALSVLNYRLWDVESTFRRTLFWIGASLTVLCCFGGFVFVLARVAGSLTHIDRGFWGYAAYVGLIALLLRPLHRRIQRIVDNHYDRQHVNPDQALARFTREIRHTFALNDLLQMLLARTIQLFHIAHGAVVLQDAAGGSHIAEQRYLSNEAANSLLSNLVISNHNAPWRCLPYFPVCLPLRALRNGRDDCIGYLALGPRLSEQPYTDKDRKLLMGLADQVGAAVAIAQLVAAERELETHRLSAAGQAEAYLRRWLAQPSLLLLELYDLANAACDQPPLLELVEALPQAATKINQIGLRNLAEGYVYLLHSRANPDLCSIGLLKIIGALAHPHAIDWPGSSQDADRFRLWLSWHSPKSTQDLAGLNSDKATPIIKLLLRAVAAHERADLLQDRLAFLREALAHAKQSATLVESHSTLNNLLLNHALQRWHGVLARAISQLQGQANLQLHWVTRQVIVRCAEEVDRADSTHKSGNVLLALDLNNVGLAPAQDIVIEILPDAHYDLIESWQQIPTLLPGHVVRVVFEVQMHLHDSASAVGNIFNNPLPETLRLPMALRFTDEARNEARNEAHNEARVQHCQEWQAQVCVLHAPHYRPIPNLYRAGTPLQPSSPVFVGRDEDMRTIMDLLERPSTHLVLSGERRMGKTSLVRQLCARLGRGFVPVMLDGQLLGIDPGLPALFYDIALEICSALDVSPPEVTLFEQRPTQAFESIFLPAVLPALAGRRLIVFIDEFEELELRVQHGKLDPDLFAVLRHLMQDQPKLSLVFVGTHAVQDLPPGLWSVSLNVALQQHLGPLHRADALQLIVEPVRDLLAYDDLALDKLLKLTGGHPYFLQVFCQTLVDEANASRRSYVLAKHVQQAQHKVFELCASQLQDIWNLSTAEERHILVALSQSSDDVGLVAKSQLLTHFQMQQTQLGVPALEKGLQRLIVRDIISDVCEATDRVRPAGYAWKLGIMQVWLARRSTFLSLNS